MRRRPSRSLMASKPKPSLAIALGLADDSAAAERLASELGKRYPEDTIVRFDYLPMIHAAIALRKGDAGRAVDALAEAAPYELGQTNTAFTFALYSCLLTRPRVLAAKQGAPLAPSFKRLWTIGASSGISPLAH